MLQVKNKYLFGVLLIITGIISAGWFARAQELSGAVIDHRAKLLRELEGIEGEIKQFEVQIEGKRQEAASFQRDIDILDAKITKTKLQIKAFNLTVQTLQGKISEKEKNITEIIQKVDREKLSLAESLRTLAEYDEVSLLESMLAYEKMSDFLGDIESLDTVQESLQDSFNILRTTKKEEEVARDEFVDKKQEQSELRALQELERKQLEAQERERKDLLKATKGKESEYKKLVTDRQKNAASIRTQLFLLQGSPSIPFEKAVEYAEKASKKTGVRPAFILGVIGQESALGSNVGQCNLPTSSDAKKWRAIMKPARDHAPYLRITAALGLNPDTMPLSCPMSVGWGGAMGPAQFIPSTWELYISKIAAATGHNPPNPWVPEDAFMASAIYLGELGANTRAGEHTAAAKYFAGGNWKSSLGRAYGNQVLAKVEKYQSQIDLIQGIAGR
ncbi:MAG: lytic murein transglycosylase [Patescibacteria group bacterium]